MKNEKSNGLIGFICIAIIVIFAYVVLIPVTNSLLTSIFGADAIKGYTDFSGAISDAYITFNGNHPFIMGFIKFAFLATCGEIISLKMRTKKWGLPTMVFLRFIIWGAFGAWITFMMKSTAFSIDTLISKKMIFNPDDGTFLATLMRAFCISALMNTTFAPTFMSLHKISDTWITLKAEKKKHDIITVVKTVDWSQFVSFTILKCLPFFWIPAHTITFCLPEQYQVVVAAFLSIVLGVLLSIKKPAK